MRRPAVAAIVTLLAACSRSPATGTTVATEPAAFQLLANSMHPDLVFEAQPGGGSSLQVGQELRRAGHRVAGETAVHVGTVLTSSGQVKLVRFRGKDGPESPVAGCIGAYGGRGGGVSCGDAPPPPAIVFVGTNCGGRDPFSDLMVTVPQDALAVLVEAGDDLSILVRPTGGLAYAEWPGLRLPSRVTVFLGGGERLVVDSPVISFSCS